ncbi:flavin reductase family protein [Dactylosporangium sp. NPDC051485]|uniref:flavin reductase family protein n=1 Tax=Dactylosporangium sp. NPDC051485 TaxID=3154846 RepID=UPI0034360E69
MSIHASDPFATPDELKSPVRRLRGRLPAAVTLWTAAGERQGDKGLTVSSMLVVDGDPGRVLGLVDEESDLWEAAESAGRFAVCLLEEEDRQLADKFGGLMPAPGGPFATGNWERTEWGPVPRGRSWAGCRLVGATEKGWSLLVEAIIERVELAAAPDAPLIHERGRYRRS